MFSMKLLVKDIQIRERVDHLGNAIVLASSAITPVSEAAALSPFNYSRIRARIEHEEAKNVAMRQGWLELAGAAWRFAPAMVLSAVLAFLLFWFGGATTRSLITEDALLQSGLSGMEQVVFAESRVLSNDELLTVILTDGEVETR